MENLRKKKLFIFDMDNCLYKDTDLEYDKRCIALFFELIEKRYGMSVADAEEMDLRLVDSHGHYLKGWHSVFPDFPFDEWFDFLMNDFKMESVVFSHMLPTWIGELTGHKVLLTNAGTRHAARALAHMGVLDVFDDIYTVDEEDIHADMYKPHPNIYKHIMKKYAVTPEETVMFEDSKTNLQTAYDLGIATVLVNREKGDDDHHVHHNYETIDHFFKEFYNK